MHKINRKTRVEVLLEQNNSDIKAVLEYVSILPGMKKTLDQHTKQLEKITDDVEAIKVGQKGFEERLTKVETKLERRLLKTA
ncbi:MAG: hypothetical protein AAB420_01310 [Patescibacteria group bacterium]